MRAAIVLPLLGAIGLAGCASHSDDVCEDMGDCSQGGDSTFIQTCQRDAKDLSDTSAKVGCGAAFDGYYACADSAFACVGATSTFPGCDAKLAALDACLAAAERSTACAELASREAPCADGAADAGAPPSPPDACNARHDCEARCYLSSVADVCAPELDELDAVQQCASACPP